MANSIKVGIAGATGYAGQELVRLITRHSNARLVATMGSAANSEPRPLPALAKIWGGTVAPLSVDSLIRDVDAVFLALPETSAANVAPQLVAGGVKVFDLSGAFRLREPAQRKLWYPETPTELADIAVYGLTERYRDTIRHATLVACPGCYPTAAILALRPLIAAGLLNGSIAIDAKSGISGAGKRPSERTHFSECHGNVAAYGIFAHRHAAEIEQELSHPVTFVPHLVPMDRGILETIYAQVRQGTHETDVAKTLKTAYDDMPFVRLTNDVLPEVKHVVGTNFCDIGWKLDKQSGRLVMVTCLDNLIKGAAGQALQNFNVSFDFNECDGLL